MQHCPAFGLRHTALPLALSSSSPVLQDALACSPLVMRAWVPRDLFKLRVSNSMLTSDKKEDLFMTHN